MKVFNLKAEVQHVIDEIMVYKWLESEKVGFDIGINQAAREWIDKHYDDWFKLYYLKADV